MQQSMLNKLPLFSGPDFYLAFRRKIVPVLRTYPSVRIWYIGLNIIEDLYSLAILLHEERLTNKTRIYATDASRKHIARAKKCEFVMPTLNNSVHNYQESGGEGNFFSFFNAKKANIVLANELKNNISFFQHHLNSEGSFNAFHAILCRGGTLSSQPRNVVVNTHLKLLESLCPLGILSLEKGETIAGSGVEHHYSSIDYQNSLFKRTK